MSPSNFIHRGTQCFGKLQALRRAWSPATDGDRLDSLQRQPAALSNVVDRQAGLLK